MDKICLKHRDNPARIYGECVGCEIDSLRAERNLFKKETLSLAKDAIRYKEALEQIVTQEFYTIPPDHAIRHIAKDALGI